MEAVNSTLTVEQRAAAAMEIWNHEKGTAAAIIIISWISKVCIAYYRSQLGLICHRYTLHCFSIHMPPICAKAPTAPSPLPAQAPRVRQVTLTILH